MSWWAVPLVAIGAVFATIGTVIIVTDGPDPGSVVCGVLNALLGVVLAVRSCVMGVSHGPGGVRIRNLERSYRVPPGASVTACTYPHSTAPLDVSAPLIVLADGTPLRIDALATYTFLDRWSGITARRVATIATWLEQHPA